MTRPVEEILEQARREGWPTSSIDAMAKHHLCGNARDSANRWFEDFEPGALGSDTGVLADPQPGAALLGPAGAASTSTTEGDLVGKLTPEELAQLRAAAQWKADKGEDTGVIDRIIDIGAGQAGEPPAKP